MKDELIAESKGVPMLPGWIGKRERGLQGQEREAVKKFCEAGMLRVHRERARLPLRNTRGGISNFIPRRRKSARGIQGHGAVQREDQKERVRLPALHFRF